MYVSGATLLQLMSSPLAQNKIASLHLFSLLRTTNNLSPVIALSTDTADHILQILYLDFQMMTLKVLRPGDVSYYSETDKSIIKMKLFAYVHPCWRKLHFTLRF